MVVSKQLGPLVWCLLFLLLPGQAMARHIFTQNDNIWKERTGIAAFQHQLDHLFHPKADSMMVPLVTGSGPVKNSEPLEIGTLQFDGQSSLQLRVNADPLQMPAPMFPYRPQELAETNLRWELSTGFQFALPSGFSLIQRTVIGSQRALDPTARSKDYDQMDASIEIPLATVNFKTRNFHLWLGRNWEQWGPGWTGSAILDSHFPSPDGFGATFSGNHFAMRYRAGRLDDYTEPDINFHRYFFGHRLDFAPVKNLRIGLSETALVATDGALPLWGLNPLLPWVMAEQELRGSMEKTNIVWAIDTVWNPGNWALYGQFLLDDYMIDSEDRDTYPDQLGLMLGLAHENQSGDRSIRYRTGVEYGRLWSWTYVHRDPELIYQAWQQGIGHPAGNDSETITTFCSRTSHSILRTLTIWGRYHRQGQIWLGTELDPVGSPGMPYPYPPVSSWWQAGLDVDFKPHSSITTRMQIGWTDPEIARDPDVNLVAGNEGGFYGSVSFVVNLGARQWLP
jgi:hypothetical protein